MKLPYFLPFFFLLACQSTPSLERAKAPWVHRSVLDQRPRMITLALHQEGYAAFDAVHCGLYKFWKGGVHLDGAPFTDVKTVQPTTWGVDYAVDSLQHPVWTAVQEAGETTLKPNFKGYFLEDEQVRLHYQLQLPFGKTVSVLEQPELYLDGDNMVRLRRQFTIENLPAKTELHLQTFGESHTFTNGTTEIEHTFVRKTLPPTENELALSLGQRVVERGDCSTCHQPDEQTIGPSYQQIAERYEATSKVIHQLGQKIQQGGAGSWGEVMMNAHPDLSKEEARAAARYILAFAQSDSKSKADAAPVLATEEKKTRPGYGVPLEGVHPSYDLHTIRPDWFQPRVAALAFLPDGRLLVSTWDSIGGVYVLDNLETNDTSQVTIKRIAAGLAEPLGMEVVDGEIFVLQKQELTQLIDHDGDEIIDEYRTICDDWGATADFHEFAFGLVYKDGYFYANLSLAMRLKPHERQHPDRGRTIRIDRAGNYEPLNLGLRTPNGIGLGVDGEIFMTDNQGRWLPGNKVIHLQEGAFHGSRAVLRDSLPDLEETPPTVWLPQDEIGNSPSEPVLMQDGIYAGQMLHGEVTHGGVKRVFLEKVQGSYQGCVFRFTQGLEAGINRLRWGPDGGLYVGGVGMVGNWGWKGRQFGLQKLKFNGKSTFEMLAVRAQPDGFEIEFTEPVAADFGESPEDFLVQQWWYQPTPSYGGPKMDLETLTVQKVEMSDDRRKVTLKITGLKPKHVVYFRLSEALQSTSGQSLWSNESWYTLNALPEPM